jgi:eukaryotic-like serine/threonine-protein kinase
VPDSFPGVGSARPGDAPARTASARTPESLGGRYVLDRALGHGGMADVWRAHDQVLDRPVAVKLVRDTAPDPETRARFVSEGRTLARLDHPGLVTLLDAGLEGDRPFLVMELVEHDTLADRIATGPLHHDEVAAVGADLARALAYVHERHIVHRDLKPSNVLLARGGRVLLADFGIAKLLDQVTAGHTQTGFTVGTAAYLAPEQVRGQRVTPASDVYSLGLVLLEALTGTRAYPGQATEAALARLSTPLAIPDHLGDDWVRLLTEMTALEPEHRPSAVETASRLRPLVAAATDETATIPTVPDRDATRTEHLPTSTTSGTAAWRTLLARHRAATVVAVLALVLLLVIGGALVATGGGGPPDTGTQGTGAPAQIQRDLQQLREAVNG